MEPTRPDQIYSSSLLNGKNSYEKKESNYNLMIDVKSREDLRKILKIDDQTRKIPKGKNARSYKVEKIDSEGNVIKVFKSRRQVMSEEKISISYLSHVIINDKIFKGFYFRNQK